MQIETDGKGNQYVDVENVRITYVLASDREQAAEWAGTDVFRIQAYKDQAASKALHMGAELMLPANKSEAMLGVIEALCQLWRATHGRDPPLTHAGKLERGPGK